MKSSSSKVLMLIPTLYLIGGAQGQLMLLEKYLTKINVPCEVRSIFLSNFRNKNQSNSILQNLYDIRFINHIASLPFLVWYSIKYRIIHLHGLGLSFYIICLLGFILQTKLIIKIPRSGKGSYLELTKNNFFRRTLFKIFSFKVFKFICLTSDSRRSLIEIGVSEQKIQIIPNGVKVEKHLAKKKFSFPLKICFVGRLIPRKQVKMILEAAQILKKDGFEEFSISIIGNGPEKSYLKSFSNKLNVSDKTKFYGEVDYDEVLDILMEMDLFILPSISEGISNALLQSCAAGCVPLVLKTQQNKEVVNSGINGFCFSNSKELAEYILKLKDSKLMEKISRSAHRNVKKNFNIEQVAKEYKILYET